jgi:peptidoglycan hydrolase-like protein with peptidoglycan-binding domain
MNTKFRKAVAVSTITAIFTLTGLAVTTVGASASTAPANVVAQLPRFGDFGPEVVRLQQAIVARGFTVKGGITGNFSGATKSALRSLQKVAGFKATGSLDARTAKFLGLVDVAPAAVDAKKPVVVAAAKTVRASSSTFPKLGERSQSVRTIQEVLIRDGIGLVGGADGIFGNGTSAAIAEYQKRRGLGITGTMDDATQAAMTPTPAAAVVASATMTIDSLPVRGQSGDAVRLLQNVLIANGVTVKGGADGVFGVATTIAIGVFQQNVGLSLSKALDVNTAVALNLIPSLAAQGLPSLDAFPVAGTCSYSDSWLAPRSGGRLHEGVDVIAARGVPVVAVKDGVISKTYTNQRLSGNAIRLTIADETYFFYAHLDGFAEGITVGSTVSAGQIIGYIGSTGSTTPHLHFEVHPLGGAAVNPYPIVKAVDACN